jgi:septation ring formation regulator EzrA
MGTDGGVQEAKYASSSSRNFCLFLTKVMLELKKLIKRNGKHESEMAALREKTNSITAALSEQHSMDLAALQDNLKSAETELRDLIQEHEQHTSELAALKDTMNS